MIRISTICFKNMSILILAESDRWFILFGACQTFIVFGESLCFMLFYIKNSKIHSLFL